MKLVAIALLCCACQRAQPEDLADVVANYEAYVAAVAHAMATGTCADKREAIDSLDAAQRPSAARMRALLADEAQAPELQRLIDERGAKISGPELAVQQAKQACAGQAGF